MILSDICQYVSEKISVSSLDENTYISTENMLPNKSGITVATNLPATEYTPKYNTDDILISNIRPYFKKIYKAQKQGGCSADVLVLRAKQGIIPSFLYYVLSDDAFFEYATATSKGTKMPRGDKIAIMKYKVPNVSPEIQQKIASILSALDHKIELNQRQNNNLEQQAQALFKSWFVDKEYEVERETTLGVVCKCELGGTPSRIKSEYWGGNIAWINSGEVNNFRITKASEYITEIGLKHSATKLLPRKTTVLAITGATLGQISLLEIDSCTNQSVVGVLENETLPYEFIYPYICYNIKELLSHQTGGAQQHINKQNVEQLTLSLPKSTLIKDYKNIVAPIFELIAKNCFESERLAAIRDALLPKLMSGEIDVSNVDISALTSTDKLSFTED